VANRGQYRFERQMRGFLAPFVRRGDLVFDVGANQGAFVNHLLGLGARVVAIEPIPELAATLDRRYRSVSVVRAALGAETGSTTLYVARRLSSSTVSTEWREIVGDEWMERSIDVPMVTLDSLVATFGRPSFVKIDVEGYEAEVLRGLSLPLPAFSFEYQARAVHLTASALKRINELGQYGFNFTRNLPYGRKPEFRLGAFADASELLAALEAEAAEMPLMYGDVYARSS
jgi:FkbM family methyltransferase